MMPKVTHLLVAATIFISGSLQADTLELANGTLLEGEFVGSSNGIIMFNTGDGIEAFPENEVIGVFFSKGVETAAKIKTKSITVPASTRLVLRTADAISSNHTAGHRFRAQLEGALVVGGVTVAPRGAYVHGRITQSGQARRLAGSSELAITFTDVMIDHQLFAISTTGIAAQTTNEAGRTVGRTARAAAVGGLIGGSSGARTGARVGVGASILTSGASINIPAGTILETSLASPLTVAK